MSIRTCDKILFICALGKTGGLGLSGLGADGAISGAISLRDDEDAAMKVLPNDWEIQVVFESAFHQTGLRL